MRRFFLVILTAGLVTAGFWLPRDTSHRAAVVRVPRRVERVNVTTDPMPDVFVLAAFLDQVATDATLAGVAAYWQTLASYVESVTPPAVAPTVSRPQVAPVAGSAGGGGGHSDAWWMAIAQCESGMQSGWRTGFFGIMDSSAAGSMPYEQQLVRAREIWARAGDGAWGCSGRAWAAVPGG